MGMDSPQSQTVRAGLIPHRWTRVREPEAESVVAAFETVIAGGGPAGLTGAYELTKHGRTCVVLEADPRLVGGISRTDEYKGYRFDIGGHRFFSKSGEINALWQRDPGRRVHHPLAAEPDLLQSQVLPLSAQAGRRALEARSLAVGAHPAKLHQGTPAAHPARTDLRGLGRQSVRPRALRDLLQVLHREGLGHADQRDLGRLGGAADQGPEPDRGGRRARLFGGPGSRKGEVIKTLIDEFQYPRLGPGQMWEAARDRIREQGGAVHLDRRVDPDRARRHRPSRRFWLATPKGGRPRYLGTHFLSTLPIRDLIRGHEPAAAAEVVAAAEALKYRDFLTVVLIVDRAETFPDTWIYIHEPDVKVGRIQNFKNWSPDLVPDPVQVEPRPGVLLLRGRRPLDHVRRRPHRAGPPGDRRDRPGRRSEVIDGCVVRMPKAYPVYDDVYQSTSRRHPPLAGEPSEPRARRPQRHAQVQQSGSFDDDRRSWPPGTSSAWASSTPGR